MTEVLDRSVTGGDDALPPPPPPPPPAPPKPGLNWRALGAGAALVGVAVLLAGVALGVDDRGRTLVLLGAGLVMAGELLVLAGPALYGPGRAGPLKWVARVAVPFVVIALLGALAGWAARPTGTQTVTADDAAGHHHDTPAAGPGPAPDDHPHEDEPTGTGGHVHGEGPAVPLDGPTQRTLSSQLAATYEATMRYPTVADARAAQLRPVGRFAPGSGAHFMKNVTEGFDPANPTMWLYAGDEPTSPVVGVMFYSLNMKEPPEGYAGPNDHWHMHTGLCLKQTPAGIDLPLPVDKDATREQCDGVGGRFMDVTGWMIHVWSAPGWESPQGVFSHDHPLLVCSDGTRPEDAPLHVGCPGMA